MSIGLLAIGHACVDIYQGCVAALVPFFVAERAYTYAAVSGIVLAASLLSSIAQPLFGMLTDRRAMPWLIPTATLLGGAGIAFSGLGGSYGLTLVFVAVSGIGIAAFHPEAARVARRVSEGSHTAMAYFSTGGNVGFALAPLMVGAAIGAGGLRWTPVLIIPALVGTSVAVPIIRHVTGRAAVAGSSPAPVGADDVRSFVRLTLAVVFRSIAFIGVGAFIALYAQQRLGSQVAGTIALTVLYLGGIGGSMLGGTLAEHWDRVQIAAWSYLLTAIAIAGVVWVPGPAIFAFLAMASAGLYVPFSLQITLGQDYLPSRVGTASGITLGLAVSAGGLASPAVGALADATSLQIALSQLILMPLLSWLMLRSLPDPQQSNTRVRADAEQSVDHSASSDSSNQRSSSSAVSDSASRN